MGQISLQRLAQLFGYAIVIVGLPFDPYVARAQYPPSPFPILQVDSAVRARLSEEWEPTNRYQHERGYCVRFTTEIHPQSFWRPAFAVYTVTEIMRAAESGASQQGLARIGCPGGADITVLHIHPPFYCSEQDSGASCSSWDPLAHQCFPSDTDMATLLRSARPFDLVQCDQWAIVPYWRPSS